MKIRNKNLVTDDRWKRKGHAHKQVDPKPDICISCKGSGYVGGKVCKLCDGLGEIWRK